MKITTSRSLIPIFIFIAGILLFASSSLSEPYDTMTDVESVKAVFDFRISDPRAAGIHLNLIHTMISDPALTIDDNKPEIVVVFIGPSVKLVSTDRTGFDPDQQKQMESLADLISSMAGDGIKFEICLAAAQLMDVAPTSILPEIKHVWNGWISVIGYQHNGYALVADF